MSKIEKTISEFLTLVNRYPSPHNGQPVRLKQTADDTFVLYFEKQRGLQSSDISFIFSFVSMGVFVEHMKLCADAFGHAFSYSLQLPNENQLPGSGVVAFATCKLTWNARQVDNELLASLRFRQTSRKKFYEGVSDSLATNLIAIAAKKHATLVRLNKQQARQAIWLDQRAVFDDMFDEKVRQELDNWLRYTQDQKQATKDGLAYDCMEMSGPLMKFIVDHPQILRAPITSWLIKQYYLRTMTDNSDVFYMLAPFATETQAFEAGTVIMQAWAAISRQRCYLHPLGTIMTNDAAHRDFLQLAGVTNETRADSYFVFSFRAGRSKVPVPSLRIPYQEHLVME